MQSHSISPIEMIASSWRNRLLIGALIKREVIGRYRGSVLGILWSFFHPLFMLTVYTFVFSVIFKARWGEHAGSKTEFALVLFAGLIVFNLFSECVNRAPGLILENGNYVKKVVFPLEILPVVIFGSALFHTFVSLLVWIVAYSILFGEPHITTLFVPLILLPLTLFTVGICWFLSSLGVYLRDVSQFISIITMVMLFLSPIFYPVTALPDKYRAILALNPLLPAIDQIRGVMFWGNKPDFEVLAIYLLGSLIVAWVGFAWFQRTRRGFADVI